MVSVWPDTQSKFLRDVVASFKKRSKALNYKCKSISCDRVIEREDGIQYEKIEIRALNGNGEALLELHLWDVRWLWVGVSPSSHSADSINWSAEGRALSANVGKELVSAFEASLDMARASSPTLAKNYDKIWRPQIAEGPKEA